ncbi:MAG: hypothetical protein U0183_31325 [Polyangiaceae bacterium]
MRRRSAIKAALLFAALASTPAFARAESASPARGRERLLVVLSAPDRDVEARAVRDAFVDHGWIPEGRAVLAHLDEHEAALARARETATRIPPRELTVIAVVLTHEGSTRAPSPAEIPAIARVAFVDRCGATAPELSVDAEGADLTVRAEGPCGEGSATSLFLQAMGGAGDVDDDRHVTAAETVAYLTSELAARGTPPKATSRAGSSPLLGVVLGHDASYPDSAEISLPREPGPAWRYRFFRFGERAPFATAFSRPDREVRVRVPKGRIIVHVREGTRSRGVDLRVSGAELHHLALTEGRTMPPEDLEAYAGSLEKPYHEVAVAYSGALGGYASFAHGASLRYAYAHADWAAGFMGTAHLAGNTNAENENLFTLFGVRGRVERRVALGAPTIGFGGGLAVELTLQTVRRRDGAALAQTGYPLEERYRAATAGPELFVHGRTTIGGTSFLGAELAAVFPFAPQGESLQAFPRLEGSIYAGLGF